MSHAPRAYDWADEALTVEEQLRAFGEKPSLPPSDWEDLKPDERRIDLIGVEKDGDCPASTEMQTSVSEADEESDTEIAQSQQQRQRRQQLVPQNAAKRGASQSAGAAAGVHSPGTQDMVEDEAGPLARAAIGTAAADAQDAVTKAGEEVNKLNTEKLEQSWADITYAEAGPWQDQRSAAEMGHPRLVEAAEKHIAAHTVASAQDAVTTASPSQEVPPLPGSSQRPHGDIAKDFCKPTSLVLEEEGEKERQQHWQQQWHQQPLLQMLTPVQIQQMYQQQPELFQQQWSSGGQAMAQCNASDPPSFWQTWGRARSRAAAAEISKALRAGGSEFERAVALLKEHGTVQRLSFDQAGCHTVQLALKLVDRQTKAELASGLRGSVAAAIRSPFANHVIQKVVRVVALHEVPFIAEEAVCMGVELATHEYGCRICCRLLEKDAREEWTQVLVDNLLWFAGPLAQDVFGHHVIEAVLEHGLQDQQQWVIEALRQDLPLHARNRYSSYVIDKALVHGKEGRNGLISDLTAMPLRQIAEIASDQYGNMFLRTLLQISEVAVKKLMECAQVPSARLVLSNSRFSRRLCEDFGESLGSHKARVGGRR